MFFCEAFYEEAVTFAQERRERLPALYYRQRLLERPRPIVEQLLSIEAENVIEFSWYLQ